MLMLLQLLRQRLLCRHNLRAGAGAAAVVTVQKVATSGSACLQQPCLHPL